MQKRLTICWTCGIIIKHFCKGCNFLRAKFIFYDKIFGAESQENKSYGSKKRQQSQGCSCLHGVQTTQLRHFQK